MQRSQAAVEYLVIIAVVIIIALVVVGVIGGFPAMTRGISERESASYWSIAEIGITRYISDLQDTSLIVQNNRPFNIRLTNITLDGTSTTPSTTVIAPGEGISVTHSKACSAAGSPYSYNAVITYVDVQYNIQNTFTGQKPLVGTCQADTRAPVISEVRNGTVSRTWAIILWTTNEAATSTVYYNSTGGTNLVNSATNATPAFVTSHYVNITGLANGTTIYYKVSSTDASNNQANSTTYSVTTAP